MNLEGEGGGGAGSGSGLTIAGTPIPRWAIIAAVAGVLAVFLLGKKKTVTEQTDTGTGLLAAEFDQRLEEIWRQWMEYIQGLNAVGCPIGQHRDTADGACHKDAPGGGTGGDCLTDSACPSGQMCVTGKCVPSEEGHITCSPGNYWSEAAQQCLPDSEGDDCYGYHACPSGQTWSALACGCVTTGTAGGGCDGGIGMVENCPDNSGGVCPAGQTYDKTLGTCIGYPISRDAPPDPVNSGLYQFSEV